MTTDEPVQIEPGVMVIAGQTYITAALAPRYLGVKAALIRDWKRRGLVTATMFKGQNWYRLTDLQNAELATNGRTKRRTEAAP